MLLKSWPTYGQGLTNVMPVLVFRAVQYVGDSFAFSMEVVEDFVGVFCLFSSPILGIVIFYFAGLFYCIYGGRFFEWYIGYRTASVVDAGSVAPSDACTKLSFFHHGGNGEHPFSTFPCCFFVPFAFTPEVQGIPCRSGAVFCFCRHFVRRWSG